MRDHTTREQKNTIKQRNVPTVASNPFNSKSLCRLNLSIRLLNLFWNSFLTIIKIFSVNIRSSEENTQRFFNISITNLSGQIFVVQLCDELFC